MAPRLGRIAMSQNTRVALVAPLDWGLGHATRCIPIIRELLEKKWEVILCADGAPLSLLQQAFPHLGWERLPSFSIQYPLKKSGMIRSMIKQLPALYRSKLIDHRCAEKWVKKYRVSLIVSDNRIGFFSKKCRSIYLSHQLRIAAPPFLVWGEAIVSKIHQFLARHFDEVWVPDFSEEPSLAGKLSRGWKRRSVRYIGLLSRFSPPPKPVEEKGILVVLSGPEPQRTLLEEELANQLIRAGYPATIVRGLPLGASQPMIDSSLLRWINFLPTDELKVELNRCELLITRSGYSTLMDLTVLSKRALLIPTPGQTEQEHLAARLGKMGCCFWTKQEELNLEEQIPLALQSFTLSNLFSPTLSQHLLEQAITAVTPNE